MLLCQLIQSPCTLFFNRIFGEEPIKTFLSHLQIFKDTILEIGSLDATGAIG